MEDATVMFTVLYVQPRTGGRPRWYSKQVSGKKRKPNLSLWMFAAM